MNLLINSLLQWEIEGAEEIPLIERILYIEQNKGIVVTIDIFSPTANPKIRQYSEIAACIENKSIRILEVDPYASLQKPDNEIQQKHKERRDANWKLIEKIVEQDGIECYLPHISGKEIASISLRTGKARKDIYAYRRRYFQSGRIKNALLPRFEKCGAHGRRRLGQSEKVTKLGRPSHKSKAGNEKLGIRITIYIEKNFSEEPKDSMRKRTKVRA